MAPHKFQNKIQLSSQSKRPFVTDPCPILITRHGHSVPLLQSLTFKQASKATCHIGACLSTVLSQQGNPSSSPYPVRFFLVFQTSLSWGNLSWPPCALFPPTTGLSLHDFTAWFLSVAHLQYHSASLYLFIYLFVLLTRLWSLWEKGLRFNHCWSFYNMASL